MRHMNGLRLTVTVAGCFDDFPPDSPRLTRPPNSAPMHFLDQAKIFVRSGAGGPGAVSFRREKYIEYGGPHGRHGGTAGAATPATRPRPTAPRASTRPARTAGSCGCGCA